MRLPRINIASIGMPAEALLSSLSRLSYYWPFSWRSLSALILGVLLAKWFWILFAPAAIYTSATPERPSSLATGQLFGVAVTTDAASQGVALPNVQLLGIFTASAGKRGFAVLKLDARQMGIAEGDEVASGTKLIKVDADHVLLERAGVQQRVDLENKHAGSPASAQTIKPLPPHGAAANNNHKNIDPGKNIPSHSNHLRR